MQKLDFERDYYADLELVYDADLELETIQTRFRKLALKFHPDRNPGRESECAAKFSAIQDAYEVLSNPMTKQQYDDRYRKKASGKSEWSGPRPKDTRNHNLGASSGMSTSATSSSRNAATGVNKTENEEPDFSRESLFKSTRAEYSDSTPSVSHATRPVKYDPLYLFDVLKDWGVSSTSGAADPRMRYVLYSSSLYELYDVLDLLGQKVRCTVTKIMCEWEIPRQISNLSLTGQSIKSFLDSHVVLVGANMGANQLLAELQVEATSCLEYVRRNMGEKGCEVLADMGDSLSGKISGQDYNCRLLEAVIPYESHIAMTFKPDTHLHKPDVQAILNTVSWICSAIRTTSHESHALSSTLCRVSLEDGTVALSLSLHDTPFPYTENNCWLPLFDAGTVSLGPRQPNTQISPGPGKGLKMTFDMLLQLSAVEFPVRVHDKLMLVGYQTALLPVNCGPSYVQFHLIVDKESSLNPYILDSSQCIPWNDSAIAEFRGKDCYIGWCEPASILLGTSLLPVKEIRYSDTRMKEKSLRLDGFGLGVQAASTVPLQAGGSLQANFRYQTNRLSFSPSKVFSQLLRNTSKELASIYDPLTKRGWIVPKLSLLLHMCHAWEELQSLQELDNENPGPIPFSNPHSDPSDVINVLENRGDMIVCGDGNDALSLRILLIGINLNLLHCFTNTEDAKQKLFSGIDLYGFDFMDIITNPGRGSCMRAVSLGSQAKAWLPLVKSTDALVICSGIGDVITADDQKARRCAHCTSPPLGQDCLTTTVQCLKTMMWRNGRMIPEVLRKPVLDVSNNLHLVIKPHCFQDCTSNREQKNDKACWNASRFQRLESRKKLGIGMKDCEKYEPQLFRMDGAIVLGSSSGL